MKEVNITLLIVEILAAIFTVMIHCPLTGEIGQVITCIARISNPLFFMVAGYYAYSGINKRKIISATIQCIKIHAVYAILALFIHYECSLSEWLVWLFSRMSLRNLFTAQMIGIWGADWFLISLILCHCCWYFLRNIKITEKILPVFLCLLLLKIWLAEFHSNIDIGIHRNFYLFAWPCYVLGMLIKKYRNYILETSKEKVCLGILLGGGISLYEHFTFNPNCDLYVGSFVSSVSLFIFTLIYEKRKPVRKSYVNLYADLYYWHLLVLNLLENLVDEYSEQWLNLKPFWVIGITCVMSVFLSNIKIKINSLKLKE